MQRIIAIVVLLAGLSSLSTAADWATFAHDNRRSYVTDEKLSPPLGLQWVYKSPAPPAAGWSLPVNGYGARKNKSNVSYDDSHGAIIAGDSVYFSSSAENCVFAVDGNSGELRWSFFTGAAPRLAPTFWQGKLYFGSDDGKVHCLSADDGSVIWTLDAAVTAETMLGYGRFSSVWPIRTGVMIDDGIAWFTAGLFPGEGVYLYAVDPETGEVQQRKEIGRLSGQTGRDSLSPQGYMLASSDSLYLTSRVSPTRFRKTDATFVPFSTPPPDVPKSHEYRFYNGGDYAQLWNDQRIVYGRACLMGYDPDEQWTNRYRKTEQGQLKFHWFGARQTVRAGDTAYFATDTHLIAIDPATLPEISNQECREFESLYKQLRVADRLEWMEKHDRIVAQYGEDHPQAVELRNTSLRYSEKSWQRWLKESPALYQKIEKRCRWMLPIQATESLILAGDVLFAGGEENVYGIDAATGELLWQDSTASRVRSLAAARGRLVVSTTDGNVRCYSTESPAERQDVRKRWNLGDDATSEENDGSTGTIAERIISSGRFTKGHALIVSGDGQLAEDLAEKTDLAIQVISPKDQLASIRARLAAKGLYGHRVNVVAIDSKELPFPPYLFNLVIDRSSGTDHETPISEIYRVTRPIGGFAVISSSDQSTRDAYRFAEVKKILGESDDFRTQNGLGVIRRGELPGARDWTHNYGSTSNTYSSEDQRVKGPFGILWFGEPGPRQRIDRHSKAPMPLVAGGVMFTIGYDRAMAYDAYNGIKYWERYLQGATRTSLPIGTSNIAADRSGLFIVVEDKACLHLDAITGETIRTFSPPQRDQQSPAYWGWLARDGDLLFGSRAIPGTRHQTPDQKHSDELFAMDVASGEMRWQRRIGRVEHDGIAIGDNVLYYVDQELTASQRDAAASTIPQSEQSTESRRPVDRRGNPIPPDLRKLVAIDALTGKLRWEVPFDASDVTLDDNAVLDGRSGVSCMVKNGMVVVHGVGSLGHPHREFLAGEFARRALYVFSASDGKYVWGGRKGYRKRPIIAGDYIYAEPFAWHLKTGEPKTILNPLSGEAQPFDFHRGYVGCSHLLASGTTLFGNKDGIGYCNLDSGEGFSSFRSLSLACGLGATPAGGIFVAPEGRSGCTCSHSGIHTSVALYPRTFSRDWAIGVTGGLAPVNSFPVKHAYVNLGAPGYREDAQKRLWIPYPGTRNDGFTGPWLPRYQHSADMFYRESSDVLKIAGHKIPWLFASGYQHEKPLSFQLQEKGQPEARYTVTLYFAEHENAVAGQRNFDVTVQGKKILQQFDIAAVSGGAARGTVHVIRNVAVKESLTISMKPTEGSTKPPTLCAVAMERE